ncbi:MAG: hypothetical protein JW910_17635 [Anaerolineae bacterium]|nr:hypothetical protein [Anaerolineae bacterium]
MATDQSYSILIKSDVDVSGDGTSNASPPLYGILWGFYIEYDGSLPAGTDLVITATLPSGLAHTLLTLTDTNTSGFYPVAFPVHDADGAAISGQYEQWLLTGDTVQAVVDEGGAAAITDAVKIAVIIL